MSRYFILIAFLLSVQSFAAMTPIEFTNYLVNKKSQGQTMTASEQAAFDVYQNYSNDNLFTEDPAKLSNYATSVYNFFQTRVGSAAVLPPDRQASQHIFLNRNPLRILRFGNTTEHIKSEADLVAKAYNTNECQQAGGNDCDLLTDQEISQLARIDRALSIKSFFRNTQNKVASDFSALGSGIVNTVRAITTPAARRCRRAIRRAG